MKLDHRIAFYRGMMAVLAFAVFGCQSEPEQLPQVSVNIPGTFQQNGINWQKQSDVLPADNQRLTRFFSLNQDLAGSPEFEGRPTVFTSGKNDRRFYWIHSAVDGMRWRCVEYRKRRFSVSDGTQNPFESPEKSS